MSWFHKRVVGAKRERFTARVLGLRSGRRFERLEDRAMLSATMGPMQLDHDPHGFAPQDSAGPQFASAGMFAPPPRNHVEPPAGMYLSDPISRPSLGAMHAEPGMMGGSHGGTSQISSSYPASNIGGSSSSWANFEGQQTSAYSQPTQRAQQTQTTYYIVIITSSAPLKASAITAPPADTYDPTPSSGGGQSPPKSSPSMAPPTDPPPSNAIRAPGSTTNEMPRGGNFASSNAVSLNSAALNIPSATQIATRDVDSAALLPSAALDAAFQSYAARLLLTTSTSAKEYSLLKSLDGDATTSDEADGEFIRMTDFTVSSDEHSSTDAVERERAAVDEVLRGLEELDTLPADSITSTVSTDETAAFDEAGFESLGAPFGFAPITDANGGMVMLRASDGANDAAFNLLSPGDANVDVLGFRVGVEASIGFYQAVDVATDDSFAPMGMPTASPVAEPVRQIERNARASTDGENSASPKAAAAIGATSLIGAMLWVSHRPRKSHAQPADSDDQRRRRVRIH